MIRRRHESFHSQISAYASLLVAALFVAALEPMTTDDGETSNRPSSSYGGHATQVLWKSTSKLGCALASCQKGGDTHEILICNYDPP